MSEQPDIVERLQAEIAYDELLDDWSNMTDLERLHQSALEEIERLRDALTCAEPSGRSVIEGQQAEIERLRARNRLMTELLNDVLGVAPDRNQGQVWCLNLSPSSSVGLPEKFHELWESPMSEQPDLVELIWHAGWPMHEQRTGHTRKQAENIAYELLEPPGRAAIWHAYEHGNA